MMLVVTGKEYLIRPVGQGDFEQILAVYQQFEDFLALGPQPAARMEMVLADLEHSKKEGGSLH